MQGLVSTEGLPGAVEAALHFLAAGKDGPAQTSAAGMCGPFCSRIAALQSSAPAAHSSKQLAVLTLPQHSLQCPAVTPGLLQVRVAGRPAGAGSRKRRLAAAGERPPVQPSCAGQAEQPAGAWRQPAAQRGWQRSGAAPPAQAAPGELRICMSLS